MCIFGVTINGFLADRLEVVKIIRTLDMDAFVNDKELTIFNRCKGMTTIGTLEFQLFSDLFTSAKSLSTNFALELAVAPIIVVNVMMGSTTTRANSIMRNRFTVSSLNRFDLLAIFPFIIGKQKLPVLIDERDNDG